MQLIFLRNVLADLQCTCNWYNYIVKFPHSHSGYNKQLYFSIAHVLVSVSLFLRRWAFDARVGDSYIILSSYTVSLGRMWPISEANRSSIIIFSTFTLLMRQIQNYKLHSESATLSGQVEIIDHRRCNVSHKSTDIFNIFGLAVWLLIGGLVPNTLVTEPQPTFLTWKGYISRSIDVSRSYRK